MSVEATLEALYGGSLNYSLVLGGKLFHVSTALLLNTFLRVFNLKLRLDSLYGCTLVLASVLTAQ